MKCLEAKLDMVRTSVMAVDYMNLQHLLPLAIIQLQLLPLMTYNRQSRWELPWTNLRGPMGQLSHVQIQDV